MHPIGKIGLRCSQENVEVIVEQGVRENAPTTLSCIAIDETKPVLAVLIAGNDFALLQAALSDVINSVSDIEARFAGHGTFLAGGTLR